MAHSVLARWAPEFAITEPEALALAKAWCDWRSHYDVMIDPKTQALVALCLTAAMIEGPRVMRVAARRGVAAKAAKARTEADKGLSATVIPMDGLRGI